MRFRRTVPPEPRGLPGAAGGARIYVHARVLGVFVPFRVSPPHPPHGRRVRSRAPDARARAGPSQSCFPFGARSAWSPRFPAAFRPPSRSGFRRRARSAFAAAPPGLPHPAFVPSPGFRTLLTACSSTRPAGLFHPAGALGVLSSELCSRPRAATPLGARCPPDVALAGCPAHASNSRPPARRRLSPSTRALREPRACEGLQTFAFRALLPRPSRVTRSGYWPRTHDRCSHEFSLSRGIAPAPAPPVDGEVLPCA